MGSPSEQHRLLGAFLRAHRERLSPAEAGVPRGFGRRRAAGLRREEVAQLSGISPTWYTWLEQGRDVSVSPEALARVAEALQLTTAERAYLFELARKRDPSTSADASPDLLPATLVAALESITAPAYVLDRLWRARGWNEPASRLFVDWLGGSEHNLLRYVFLEPRARTFICDWESRARRLLAEFRADTATRVGDPEVAALVEGLKRASPLFARHWEDHSVLEREGGARAFNDPRRGRLLFEQVTLSLAGRSGYKLVMLVKPARESSALPAQGPRGGDPFCEQRSV